MDETDEELISRAIVNLGASSGVIGEMFDVFAEFHDDLPTEFRIATMNGFSVLNGSLLRVTELLDGLTTKNKLSQVPVDSLIDLEREIVSSRIQKELDDAEEKLRQQEEGQGED